MNRRLLLLCTAGVLLTFDTAIAKGPPPIDGGGVAGLDLQTQLEKGLKARRPVEFEYIAEIIQLVEANELPRDLVTSTFLWARRKQSRQLQYFQFALQARARQQRVKARLPDLRKQAVGVDTPSAGDFGIVVD